MQNNARSSHALARSVLCLYLPVLVAMPFGPLLECQHCVTTYLKIFPVIPGVLAVAVTGLFGSKLLVSFLGTGIALAGAFFMFKNSRPRVTRMLMGALSVLSFINAVAVANMLRA